MTFVFRKINKPENRDFPPIYEFPPEVIYLIRRLLGLNRKQFAKLMHVTPDNVTCWERGRRIPSGVSLRFLSLLIFYDLAFIQKLIKQSKIKIDRIFPKDIR